MFRNYLKIGWRNLLKNKGFSIINITGLATGLACFVLISLYVVDELSYDKYNEKADQIYRINADINFGGNKLHLAVNSDPMGATLKRDYPQVEEFTRFYNSNGSKLIKKGNDYIEEQHVVHADSTLFNVFTLPAVAGDTKTALDEPNTVVITESTAKKYFGSVDAVGKTIEADKTPYKVTAVIKDIPHNSHFNFDFIFSMKNVTDYQWGNYLSHNFQTYIVLKKGTDYKAFEKNFAQVIDKYILPAAKQFMQINSMEEFKKAGNKLEYSLMPLTDIHLKSDRFPELGVNGNMQYVYIFGAVAIFVLLIACVNFMNLSTARSASRAKEVGIRKVLGTERRSLISQFLTESTIMVVISLVLALLIAALVLPYFNNIAAKSLSIKNLLDPRILVFLVALPFAVGLLAGFYPAFFLSGFQPIKVLAGKGSSALKKNHLRSTLVVFQFATSIILIIGTIVVYRQLNYIQTKNLGFNKDQVLVIGTGALDGKVEAYKNEILGLAGVKMASVSGFLPVENSGRNDNTFSSEAVMSSENGVSMQRWAVDYNYINTLGMQIIKGRNFSKEFGSDSSAVILNETAARLFGFNGDPVGKKIYTFGDNNTPISYNVVGIVKNFHFESLRQNIGPLGMMLGKSTWLTSFKVDTKNIQGLVKQAEVKWKAMSPGMPFSYRFLDQDFDNMYRSEQRVGKIAITFAILAIVIACLGLFGLATYMAEQRTKEIGIRKVLGASVTTLAGMLSKDFLKLVIISFCIAVPLSWWAMYKWLQDFAYRVNISWWIFLLAGVVAVLIALVTVSFQAVKAALANPVKSLRTE
jgi:putative ABC transport system permease protein